jgi:hypothetical protein
MLPLFLELDSGISGCRILVAQSDPFAAPFNLVEFNRVCPVCLPSEGFSYKFDRELRIRLKCGNPSSATERLPVRQAPQPPLRSMYSPSVRSVQSP